MDEKDILEEEQEFTLEDIMREFAGEPETVPEEPDPEQAEPETLPEEPEEAAPEVLTEEENAAMAGDTVRLDRIPDTHGTVRNAAPVTEEEPAPEPEKAEPYSEEWEPEYEQPIAEYVPPQPIQFRPRTNFRELKRKLVNGPERQYYALSEQGLGKLQAAIFFSVLVVLLSAAATALYAFGFVGENRLRLMVFGQFLAMLLSALLGSYQLLEGGIDLIRGRFSLNSLLLFTFLLCCADGVMGLRQLRVPCCAAFSLQVTMSLWNAYQKRNVKLGQLDTMRKATHLDSIGGVDNYYEDATGLLRGEGQVEHFMDTYEEPARLERVQSVYAIVALCVSVAVGVLAGVLHGASAGIQVAAVTILAAMPASMFITLSRPMAVLERRLHAIGTVLCGWQGVEGLSAKAVFPLDHNDLFPAGTVKMNGVKFFGSRQPDEIIAYAAALIASDGGSLEPLFTHLLDSRNGVHFSVENLAAYDGGIGGEVNGEPVLAGSLSLLKEMGVEVPEGIRVSQAVCVAIDGELCGLFAITYDTDHGAAAGIATLCGYRKLSPVMLSGDFMLTGEFLRSSFGINPRKMLFPTAEQRTQLREKELDREAPALALITGKGLAAFGYAVTGARSLKTAAKLGLAVHMAGGILGVAMMVVLALIGALELLTPANLFLYELVWMVPGLLITEWTRNL